MTARYEVQQRVGVYEGWALIIATDDYSTAEEVATLLYADVSVRGIRVVDTQRPLELLDREVRRVERSA
jgi:hypothetical protein